MIQFFRNALSSWLVLGLLGLVLIAFVVTGVHDPFGGRSAGAAGTLASVGDARVTEQEFGRFWQRQLEQARERNPGLTGEALARAGGVDQLFNEIVSARAIEDFGRAQGVTAGAKLIDGEIASIPAFQLAGRFDQASYEAALRAQRLTDRELRQSMTGDLVRRQLVAPLDVTADLPPGLARPYASLLLERKEGLIGVVPAALVPNPPAPSDADLRAFYTSRKAALTIPERRTFRYALIDPDEIGAKLTITDADIEKFYRDNPARFGGTEKRVILQAALPSETDARQFSEAVNRGEAFEAAAKRIGGLDRSDIELGDLTRADFLGGTDEKTASAVFGLAEGGVSAPLQTPFGWRVFKVVRVVKSDATPLAAARADIETELRKSRAQAVEADIADKAQSALADGATFADVAKRFGLPTVSVPAVTRSGASQSGFQLDPRARALLDSAFAAEPGEEPSIEDLGEGRGALFELGDVTPPTLPPFDEIKPQLAASWALDWKGRRAAALAADIVKAVKAGQPLPTEMAARGLQPPQSVNGRRLDLSRQQPGTVAPPLLLFFEMAAGDVRTLPAPNGQGAFIIQVVKTTPGADAEIGQLLQVAQRQFGQAASDEIVQQFALAARSASKVVVNEGALAALRARLSGQADQAGR